MARAELKDCRRVVVKIGSQSLANDEGVFARVAKSIAAIRKNKIEVTLVSSGAIALGLAPLGLAERPRDLASLQAAAAAGQSALMQGWAKAFSPHGINTAQVLLTHGDLVNRRRYLNAKGAMQRLHAAAVIPIVNENDTVSVEEIKLGDNDVLAAEIASLLEAQALVLLTKAPGLFDKDPSLASAKRISFVDDIDALEVGFGKKSALGTGGIETKIEALRIAIGHGIKGLIAAPDAGSLEAIFAGADIGTLFAASSTKRRARKRWIAVTLRPKGHVEIDAGAFAAISKSASLLFAGVREVKGDFARGDCIDIVCENKVVARGLSALDAESARRVKGARQKEAQAILGDALPDELIHRDDLVIKAYANDIVAANAE